MPRQWLSGTCCLVYLFILTLQSRLVVFLEFLKLLKLKVLLIFIVRQLILILFNGNLVLIVSSMAAFILPFFINICLSWMRTRGNQFCGIAQKSLGYSMSLIVTASWVPRRIYRLDRVTGRSLTAHVAMMLKISCMLHLLIAVIVDVLDAVVVRVKNLRFVALNHQLMVVLRELVIIVILIVIVSIKGSKFERSLVRFLIF